MFFSTAWAWIVNTGVQEEQSLVFSHKLQNRNRLCLLCILFSSFYLWFFLNKQLALPSFAISIGLLGFTASVILNHFGKYFLSSLLVLINTNYCVLFFSIYLGFDSGIHLYLLTSPLIVLSLFHSNRKNFIALAMLSYILCLFIVLLVEKYFQFHVQQLDKESLSFLYILNFSFSILILISLSLYFLFHNEKINTLLNDRNEELKVENSVRKQAEDLARQTLQEREILLSEVHHRVKNNLAIISGLINLQVEDLKDEESKKIFMETKDRIYSMSLIHNQLYQNKSFAQIEFAQYISTLCSHIQKSYPLHSSFLIRENTEPVQFDIKTAIPCALILNELVTNAFRHAFVNVTAGTIEVGLKIETNCVLFWVSDTGVGMDRKFLEATSMGMSLIHSLIDQIDGKLHFENGNGSKFLIRLQYPVT
jgi:two-component sensor histidine kinase